MLVDKTNFGLVLYNHANFYGFEETSSYWSVKRMSVFLCLLLVNQRHTSDITVYNRTVTNTEKTVRTVHSCNSWLYLDNVVTEDGLTHQNRCIKAKVSKRTRAEFTFLTEVAYIATENTVDRCDPFIISILPRLKILGVASASVAILYIPAGK